VSQRRRLTVALVVTGDLAREIDGMRRALGATALSRIPPHCTLVPPVNVREECVETVLDDVQAAAAKCGPISVALGPPDTFWPRTPVLYLAVGGDVDAMAQLRDSLQSGPLAPPESRHERDFVPHLTLDQRIDPGRLAHALAALADYRANYCFERVSILQQDPQHHWQPLSDAALCRGRIVGRGSLDLEVCVFEDPGVAVGSWADALWRAHTQQGRGFEVGACKPYAILASSDGNPVGFADGEVGQRVFWLKRLVVEPASRGQGIGTHLLRSVERLGIERGCERVRLATTSDGDRQRFFVSHGYVVTGTIAVWEERSDFAVMERNIAIRDLS
jgi:2'-5' RNA ligase/ribosomal protein S18 acetylase RimI-like enzyme